MKKSSLVRGSAGIRVAIAVAVIMALRTTGLAYETYQDIDLGGGNCFACHGVFRGTSTSTKGTVFPGGSNHQMHQGANSMNTDCNLCHTGTDRSIVFIGSSNGTANNSGLGCTGCHNPLGLRKHHKVNGITVCGSCHKNDAPPPPETTKPPYYGTFDTLANNPANTLLAANTNENWSVGDFLGLDNNGDNLYDLADYGVGPFKILSLVPEGNNMRVTFQTAGGRTNTVQTSVTANGTFTNAGTAVVINGVGIVTTNFLHLGGATNASRLYRLTEVVP